MMLVDTSVWVDHLRGGNRRLQASLETDSVLIHPLVIGELACGSLRDRSEVLTLLSKLPQAATADHDEVLRLVEQPKLFGTGIGWIDAHLLTSALLTGAVIWTQDKRLSKTARQLRIAA